MANYNHCVVCGETITDEIYEIFGTDWWERADALGMETLTEGQQVVVMGKICSWECYEHLDV
jgi:hypothetical protein